MTSTIQLSKEFKALLKKEAFDSETYEDTIKRLINCTSEEVEVVTEQPAFSLEGWCFAWDGGKSSSGSNFEEVSFKELREAKIGSSWYSQGDHSEEATVLFKDESGVLIRFLTLEDYSYTNISNLGVNEDVEVVYFNFL